MKKEDKIKLYGVNNFYKILVFALIQIQIWLIANRADFYGLGISLYTLSILITFVFAWWISKESKKQFSEGEQIENTKKLIKEGKFNFVVKIGIIYFGIPFAVLMYLTEFGFTWNANWISYHILEALIIGTFFGLVLWWWINRKIRNK